MMPELNHAAPSTLSPDLTQTPVGLEQRLLTEAVRSYEDAQGVPFTDLYADTAARAADGDLEHRLIVRACSLPVAADLRKALQHLHSAFRLTFGIGLVILILTGATTARITLGSPSDGPVINFFLVLGSLLGLNTVMLLIWGTLIAAKPGAVPTGSLGNAVFLLGRRVAQWLHRGPLLVPMLQAIGSVYARSPIGRWTLSALSHSLWLAFLSGCLVTVIWVLSIKQYTFVWETTILSDRSYVTLTRVIASIPEALGFITPDDQQITASHWTGQGRLPAESREAWSGLLIGSLVAYGILPRAVLLLLCLLARRRACRQFRLDTTLPGYARLQTRLLPTSQPIGVVDPEQGIPAVSTVTPVPTPLPSVAHGPTAILGFEIERPGSAWPPPLDGVEWLDLGFVDSRHDRRQALEQVRSAPTPPRLIAVVCSVTTTPDRGTCRFLNEVRQSSSAPLLILLTDGQRLREREPPPEVEQRFTDWRRLAASAAIAEDQVIDVDLEHLTDTSRARLAALLGGTPATGSAAARLEQAFTLILEQARRWTGTPPAGEQAELHQAIAALYNNERSHWRSWLKIPINPAGDLLGQAKVGARQMLDLLPARLRANPRWYAAGALAGALSCIAAATLVAPAAIASLPLWAGLGAVLGALVKPAGAEQPAADHPPIDLSDAVNGAALFALVLELQGRPEVVITRILDRLAGEGDPPVLKDVDAVRRWLDELCRRFALACQVEGGA
jgi:hypothetical protein